MRSAARDRVPELQTDDFRMRSNEQGNICVFSPCRTWRYVLRHYWGAPGDAEKAVAWIALNPSTADENRLDPTLRRIRGFSADWGYNCFYMLNAFGFRATDPSDMRKAADPVGPDNDKWILEITAKTNMTVCAWGRHGAFRGRDAALARLLSGRNLFCLERTKDGIPKHPLYLKSTLTPVPFTV